MDIFTVILIIALVAVGGVAIFALSRSSGLSAAAERTNSEIVRMAELIAAGQNDLAGRLATITETSAAAQTALTKTLNERLDAVSKRLGDSLEASSEDRKSTRLNSSHVVISYAVFCLKKKKRTCKSTCTQEQKKLECTQCRAVYANA